MKKQFRNTTRAVGSLLTLATCAFVLLPTQPAAAQMQKSASKKHAVKITGCLRAGDEPTEFMVTGAHGKLYGLTSKHVNLKDHVGHTVTVSGVIVPEANEHESEQPAQGGKSAEPSDIDVNVSSLKMIKASCN